MNTNSSYLRSRGAQDWKIPRRREEYSERNVRTRTIHTHLKSIVRQHVAIMEVYKGAVRTKEIFSSNISKWLIIEYESHLQYELGRKLMHR